MDKRFLQYKVTFKRDKKGFIKIDEETGYPEIESKELTDLGHVMITEQQADWYNKRSTKSSRLFYILDADNPENLSPEKLKEIALEKLKAEKAKAEAEKARQKKEEAEANATEEAAKELEAEVKPKTPRRKPKSK